MNSDQCQQCVSLQCQQFCSVSVGSWQQWVSVNSGLVFSEGFCHSGDEDTVIQNGSHCHSDDEARAFAGRRGSKATCHPERSAA